MQYCRNQNINKLIVEFVGKGWTYSQGRHGKLRAPNGRYFVTIACTPSDHRSFLNVKRDLRRALAASCAE
jgi:predicted acylesterase/phospholipase RssA